MTQTRPLAAAGAMVSAMAIIGFIDNFVVVVAETHGLWQFQVMRLVLALPVMALAAFLGAGSLLPIRLWAVAARSMLISGAMILYFGSLAFLPISEVAAGLFTAPIWVLILTVLSGRGTVGAVRGGAVVLGFLGVLMVLRPDTGGVTPVSLVPVAAGFIYALGALSTRAWCAEESTNCLLLGNFVALAIIGAIGMAVMGGLAPVAPPGPEGFLLRGWLPLTTLYVLWMSLHAIGAVVGVWLLIRSYQWGEASFSASFEYSLLISISAWAYLLRGEVLDPWAAGGIGLIIVSGAVIALRGR